MARFLNHHEFAWNGYEWQIPTIGSHWLVTTLLNPSYRFKHDLYDEIGLFAGWKMLDWAERQIFKSWRSPVVVASPDPIVLRKWIDIWIELGGCRIYTHVYEILQARGDTDAQAHKRASELKDAFEQLYLAD